MEPPLPRRLVTGVRMMKPDVRAFFDEDTFTVSYVVSDSATKACAIVDSVLDFDPASGRTTRHSADAIIAFVRQQGLAEIGRASCRERVCQSVSISVGAVSLKKKKHQQQHKRINIH